MKNRLTKKMLDCLFFSIKINKALIYVLSYWLAEIVFRFLNYFKPGDFNFIFTENTGNNEYLYIILLTIADLLAFFGKVKKCEKSKEKEELMEENVINNEDIEYGSQINYGGKKTFLCLVVIIVFDLAARFIYYSYYAISNKESKEVSQKFMHDCIILIDILVRYIFYKAIIKKCKTRSRKFGHTLFSIISLLILFSLLIFIDYINLDSSGKYNFNDCLIFSAIISSRSILFPLADTLAKKFMVEKHLFPSKYMQIRGLFEAIALSIITPILILTSHLNFSLNMFTLFNGVMALSFILLSSIKAFLLLKVIYEYSSQAVSFLIISEPLSESIYDMINNVNHENKRYLLLTGEIIIIFFIAIITMIYEEIIIIKICGCDENVKDTINERAEDDMKKSDYYEQNLGETAFVDISQIRLSINMDEQ